jgi:hypothetical protein
MRFHRQKDGSLTSDPAPCDGLFCVAARSPDGKFFWTSEERPLSQGDVILVASFRARDLGESNPRIVFEEF